MVWARRMSSGNFVRRAFHVQSDSDHRALLILRVASDLLYLTWWDYRRRLLRQGLRFRRALEQLYSYAVTSPQLRASDRADQFAA